jgi:hypothetical protein
LLIVEKQSKGPHSTTKRAINAILKKDVEGGLHRDRPIDIARLRYKREAVAVYTDQVFAVVSEVLSPMREQLGENLSGKLSRPGSTGLIATYLIDNVTVGAAHPERKARSKRTVRELFERDWIVQPHRDAVLHSDDHLRKTR